MLDASSRGHPLGRAFEGASGAMVRLIEAGTAIEEAAPGHVEATRRHFFDLLMDKEIDVLTALFERVLANLDRARAD